jgi:hypothetical protein
MFGFLKTAKEAKAAQKALTAAFEARGYMPFMTMHNTIHDALVNEATATGVEAKWIISSGRTDRWGIWSLFSTRKSALRNFDGGGRRRAP